MCQKKIRYYTYMYFSENIIVVLKFNSGFSVRHMCILFLVPNCEEFSYFGVLNSHL
jgi:hypothetical protein